MDISLLTQKELLHFALYATTNNRSDHSIMYLKAFLKNEPNHVDALFLLGSEYAEINMYDEAIVYLERALAISPDAHLIRFQLGMMQLTLGNDQNSRETITPLLSIDDNNPIKHFALGINSIIAKNALDAVEKINKGLQLGSDNISLVNNMTKLVETLNSNIEQSSSEEGQADNSMFLSIYNK